MSEVIKYKILGKDHTLTLYEIPMEDGRLVWRYRIEYPNLSVSEPKYVFSHRNVAYRSACNELVLKYRDDAKQVKRDIVLLDLLDE
jgi:hypothetical protein